MQSAGSSGAAGYEGGGGPGGHGSQFHSFLQPPGASASGNGAGKAAEGDGDLPMSLPSYAPSPSGQLPFGYDMMNRGPAGKPGAGGQGGLFASRGAGRLRGWYSWCHVRLIVTGSCVCFVGNGGGAEGDGNGARGDGTQRSPSAGMSTMSFQDSGAQMYNGGAGSLALKLGRQEAIAGISAAQFAASTGGLTMDTALLARVSGTDPSLMGTEEIKQIMRTPDLLSIYQKLQEEDDRRQRR